MADIRLKSLTMEPVEASGFQRQTHAERRAIRRSEAQIQPLQQVTRRFNNLPKAFLWANRNRYC